MAVVERGGKFYAKVHTGNGHYQHCGTYDSREDAERAEQLRRPLYPRPCEVCGLHGSDVHHINRNHSDDRPENLIYLCRRHHKRAHTGRLIWDALEEITHVETVEDAWRIAHAALRGTVPEKRPLEGA